MRRTNVLGVGVSSLNMDGAVQKLLEAREKGQTGYVCVTGVHGIIESQRDPELKKIHNRSFLTVPDGMPTVWMGREQGFVNMGRVYGPDLMLRLMAATSEVDKCSLMVDEGQTSHDVGERTEIGKQRSEDSGRKTVDGSPSTINHQPSTGKMSFTHFLYGATEEMLARLKENLEERFPGLRIVGTYAPPFRPLNGEEEEDLRQIVAACKPDFFWVGLSTPKQERFMFAHSASMNTEDGGQRTGDGGQRTEDRGQRTEAGSPSTINDQLSIDSGAERYPLDAGIMLGVGAAFPIHAGLQKDAPEWIKNSGLQWLHRLCQEPRRLWRRYLDIIPAFLWLAALQLLGIRKYRMEE